MNFIIPKNYNFKSKILGFIDYPTAIFNLIWAIVLYLLANIFFYSIWSKIYFFVALFIPVLIFSIVGFNQENILYVIKYTFKYFFSQKIYLYK